ncbi:GTP cyclohydrolase I [Sphingomonas sp.]|uniref:GTP cyclohydrolase I n=1 Tax=Sphingomonas sp. TaxID=28214 RepID=UPI0035B22EE1
MDGNDLIASRPAAQPGERLSALVTDWGPALGNEAVGKMLDAGEFESLLADTARAIENLFDVLGVDHVRDHNTRDTPSRVAKMLVCETLRGRYQEPPSLTEFQNAGRYGDLIVTGPIDVRSTCAHHLMPIYGTVCIGVIPAADGKIIGLSKYDRVVDYFASRLQIQEELIVQIGEFLMERTKPCGLALQMSAVHMCKTHRGVRAGHAAKMVSSAYYGTFCENPTLKAEFVQHCLSLQHRG